MAFTEKAFNYENEKDWQYQIGLLSYEDHIVFTKANLISFIKHLGVEVDTNGQEIKKLPRYVEAFGKLDLNAGTTAAPAVPKEVEQPYPTPPSSGRKEQAQQKHATPTMPSGDAFKPTRKVRELPGGGSAQIASLFGGPEEEEPMPARRVRSPPAEEVVGKPAEAEDVQVVAPAHSPPAVDGFRPTRKVRELPGGGSKNIAALFGGDE